MRRRLYLSIVVIACLVLLSYVSFCVSVRHILSPSQFVRFGTVLAKAAVLHNDEGGGGRVVELAREVLLEGETMKVASLSESVFSSAMFSVRLPKYSLSLSPETNHAYTYINQYLTFSTDKELEDYYQTQLPAQGWQFVDRMGSMRTFKNGTMTLSIGTKHYLTTGISELDMSLHTVQP